MSGAVRQDVAGILASAAAGDQIAFARIVEAHDDEMYRVCMAVGRDQAVAADGVQAAWAIAWRKLGTIRDPDRLRPWLVAIAVNETKTLLKRRPVRPDPLGAPSSSDPPSGLHERSMSFQHPERDLRRRRKAWRTGIAPNGVHEMSIKPRHRSIVAAMAAASIALVTVASIATAAGPNGAGQGSGPNGTGAGTCANATCPNVGQVPAPRRGWGQPSRETTGTTHRGGRGGSGMSVGMGTLTAEQRDMMAYMAEEEKLAHDLYVTLGSIVGGSVLPRIAESEARHLEALRNLMVKYRVTDPTVGLGVGAFSTSEFQGLYDSLLAQGRVSLAAAHGVGEIVERDDIAELAKAADGVSAPNVLRVYTNLLAGSERHLAEFQAQ